MTRTLITLLVALLPVTAFADNSPDLCADVVLTDEGLPLTDIKGRTLSRFCEATDPLAPVWDDDVCCTFDADGAHCTMTDELGRCAVGAKMWCEYGEQTGAEVTCYQPLEDLCDLGYCVIGVPPTEPQPFEPLCCYGTNICYHILTDSCDGEIGGCANGVTNLDGTVDCFDVW